MKNERGQAMIILAFALLALAAFAGLAIDGGRTYTARRQAQNTVDASAMAGTRLLAEYIKNCTPGDLVTADNLIAAAMVQIARTNEIDVLSADANLEAWYVNAGETRLGRVGWGGGIPAGSTGIEANLTVTDTTTFLRVVGRTTMSVNGQATAMAGPVVHLTGGGVLPIGIWEGIVDELNPGDEFTVFDDATYCRDQPCDFTGHHIPGSLHGYLNMRFIYNVDLWRQDLERTFNKTVGNGGCKFNADGSVDVAGTGLKGWAGEDINNDGMPDCPYPYPIFAGARGALNGDYIHADPGMRAATLQAIDDGYIDGTLVYAPIFDYIYVSDDMETVFGSGGPKEPDIGWARGAGGENASFLHIVGFVGTLLTDISPTGGNKHITGEFVHAIIGEGVISPSSGLGSGACTDMTVWAVQLWE